MPPLVIDSEIETQASPSSRQTSSSCAELNALLPEGTSVHNLTNGETSPRRKRKRTVSADSSSSTTIEREVEIVLPEASEKKHPSSVFTGVRPPPLVYPKSLYTGCEPPLPTTKERILIKEILEAEKSPSALEEDDFISIDLEHFSVYRPHQVSARKSSKISTSAFSEKPRSNELVSLQELHDRGSGNFYLDGSLSIGEHHRHVQKVAFEILSIGAYEDTTLHTVGPDIWLQSYAGRASNIWYRLVTPAPEYLRYHGPFVWLADLAKHVVDFIHAHNKTHLNDFRSTFSAWMTTLHGLDPQFLSWRQTYPRTDFRHAVAAHATFLYNQAGVLGSQYVSQPLWTEIDPVILTAIPREISQRKSRTTVVTPFVYECFSHMPWEKFLDPVKTKEDTIQDTQPNRQDVCSQHTRVTSDTGPIAPGDIVAIKSDTNTSWKTKDEYWYAYVQGRKNMKRGEKLDLIWLYRPADTACQNSKYPYPYELFLSDHCNCNDSAIYASEVAHKVQVSLFVPPSSAQTKFFIRQKYSSEDAYWESLQLSHFQCSCLQKQVPLGRKYDVGDTVLVRASLPKESLEPVVILEHAANQDFQMVRVKRLLRKRDDFGDLAAEANELVISTRDDTCDISAIVRRCHVRCYTPSEREQGLIPAPYNRNGTGDCYYVLYEESVSGQLETLDQPWPLMKQGFDPLAAPARKPWRGLDIFCGGGSLGRGLEESQAVKNEWAVDYFSEAIHTYYANLQHPAKLFNGSVNDYLVEAINGRGKGKIAQKGQVEFICAGSPCQGFSVANLRFANDQSLINISMVASVVAFVDFYRPKYVVMENVLGMANSGPKRAGLDNNVFAQVLCALVGLGYQVRPTILDAWNFGAPQGRTRLFITAAAPGLEPLAVPPPSHSHPETIIGRALGRTANGLSFGAREWAPTPFEYVSIGEGTKDLPENLDARTACIPYPDHRVTRNLSELDNVRLSCVPRFPPGMTFVKAAKLGWQPPPQMAAWHWGTEVRSSIKSMAFQRAKSNALLPTVTTANSPTEALTGSALHWDCHRCLTVMEARRAQGYPDNEVIIGSPSMQWKIIGNSVARPVAIALGMCLREVWLANGSEGSEVQCEASAKDDVNERKQAVLPDVKDIFTQHTRYGTPSTSKLAISIATSRRQPDEGPSQAVSSANRTGSGTWEDSLPSTPDSSATAQKIEAVSCSIETLETSLFDVGPTPQRSEDRSAPQDPCMNV